MVAYILSYICFSVVCYQASGSAQVSQERAVVALFDPAYVESPHAFTFRARRGEAYKSNITFTTLHQWGNNISIALGFDGNKYGSDLYIKGKLCDTLKINWLDVLFKKHMYKKLDCPAPPGSYGLYNLELPPKDFPFPMPKGQGVIHAKFLKSGKRIILHCWIKVNIV